jgi:hypothetical protein
MRSLRQRAETSEVPRSGWADAPPPDPVFEAELAKLFASVGQGPPGRESWESSHRRSIEDCDERVAYLLKYCRQALLAWDQVRPWPHRDAPRILRRLIEDPLFGTWRVFAPSFMAHLLVSDDIDRARQEVCPELSVPAATFTGDDLALVAWLVHRETRFLCEIESQQRRDASTNKRRVGAVNANSARVVNDGHLDERVRKLWPKYLRQGLKASVIDESIARELRAAGVRISAASVKNIRRRLRLTIRPTTATENQG